MVGAGNPWWRYGFALVAGQPWVCQVREMPAYSNSAWRFASATVSCHVSVKGTQASSQLCR
jgi:hypothetical protein